MKFDITRAWKDETYRQSLSAEQLRTLPANPVGELADADLATIFGAGGGGFSGGAPGMGGGAPIGGAPVGGPVATPVPVPVTPPPVGGFSSFVSLTRNESAAVALCDVSIFSVVQLPVIPLLSPTTQVCTRG